MSQRGGFGGAAAARSGALPTDGAGTVFMDAGEGTVPLGTGGTIGDAGAGGAGISTNTAGAAVAADTGGATVSTNPAGARLMMAWSSGIVGRSAGLRFKQRRARSANSGGRVAGKETVSDRSLDHVGADRVSASTMITPRDQMSPAAEVAPSLASGRSDTDR